MHHHPETLRQAMRARESELHTRAARMNAGARLRAPDAAVVEPSAAGAARRGLGALVAQLVLRRPAPNPVE